MARFIPLILLLISFSTACGQKTLRVLAVGNSFSEDALEQEFAPLAAAAGQKVIVGNLYFPGCSLDRHYRNILEDTPEYSYRKLKPDSSVDTVANATLRAALLDEPWDVITFQQASYYSGKKATMKSLAPLMAEVREIVGPHPEFLWHMTWAYSPDSEHDGFAAYGRDQRCMYDSITAAVKTLLADNPEIKGVIPTGTAIQNARGGILGKDLTRDGYHLDLRLGRYIAAATWFEKLFKKPLSDSPYIPEGVTPREREAVERAVDTALARPLETTSPK